jgi:hypothetical protein
LTQMKQEFFEAITERTATTLSPWPRSHQPHPFAPHIESVTLIHENIPRPAYKSTALNL